MTPTKSFLVLKFRLAEKVNETRSLKTNPDRIFADCKIENMLLANYSGRKICLADEVSDLVSFDIHCINLLPLRNRN